MGDQGIAVIPAFEVAMMLAGATPVKSLVDGYNMFVTPKLPARIGDETAEVTEALKHGSTVFVSQEFYDRLVEQFEARQAALIEED